LDYIHAISRSAVRAIDQQAIDVFGMADVVLMENAGAGAARHIITLGHHHAQQKGLSRSLRVVVLCGGGNNGGDGFVIARHLHNAGMRVEAIALRALDRLPADAGVNALIASRMGLVTHVDLEALEASEAQTSAALGIARVKAQLAKADLIVDCLLGTGFEGEVRPPMDAVILACNEARRQGAMVVAIDVPSGLDCQTGAAAAATVVADLTVTFVAVKQGFCCATAQPYLGRVEVVDIGVPRELVERAMAMEAGKTLGGEEQGELGKC